MTGNIVIDALFMAKAKTAGINVGIRPDRRVVLITSHRGENFREPISNICRAIRMLAMQNSDVEFLYLVHPNPNKKDVVYEALRDHSNIHLCGLLDYAAFITALTRPYIVISDLGGVQEEPLAFGKPVLVLGVETERSESVELRVAKKVVSTFQQSIEVAQLLLDAEDSYFAMARDHGLASDGRVSMLSENFS